MSCYRRANSSQATDTSNVDGTCGSTSGSGSFAPCCPTKGEPRNLCLSSYLCWEGNPPVGGTGFLTASCTDSSYESGECNQHCADNPVPDITYNAATGLWACCSWTYEGGIDCDHPTDETFSAPAPQILLAAANSASSIYPSSATSTSTGKTVSTSATTSTPTSSGASQAGSSSSPSSSASSAPRPSSSGLSAGAEAGIGIGAAIGIIALLIVAFLLGRRQKHKKYPAAAETYHSAQTIPSYKGGGPPSVQKYRDDFAYPMQNSHPIEKQGHGLHEVSGDTARGAGPRHAPYELYGNPTRQQVQAAEFQHSNRV